jgi:thiosulfate/3-mercaptopyruvate sulfurtransferase
VRSTSAVVGSVLTLCLASTVIGAQQRASNPRDAILVSTAWLAAHQNDPNLVLLHVGDPAEYQARHIPGARFVTLDDISVSDHSGHGLMLEMPPSEQLRQSLAKLGISDDSRIVVYYGKDRVTPTTRVMFTLDYAGLGKNSAMLDGGMDAWTRDGHSVTDAATPERTGKLSALSLRPIVVTADYVRAHLGKPGVSVVDGRASVFYDGVQTGGGPSAPHRAGHVAGAKSVPFTEITDESLKLRSTEQLASLFTKAGVQPGDTVIGYCHIGQQATGMLFAARSLGHPVLLYDGSFEDWSRHPDFPVDNPSAKGKP